MAIAFVQSKPLGSTYLNSVPVTMDSPVSAGSLLVMVVSFSGSTANAITGVTDNRGNTWTKFKSEPTSDFGTDVWYTFNTAAGSTTVTLALDAYYTTAVVIQEFSGVATTSPLDKHGIAVNNTSYLNTTTVALDSSTTQADALIVGISGGNHGTSATATYTVGSGYSNFRNSLSPEYSIAAMQSRIVTSTGSYTSTMGANFYSKSVAAILAFKAAGGSPPVTPTQGLLQMF